MYSEKELVALASYYFELDLGWINYSGYLKKIKKKKLALYGIDFENADKYDTVNCCDDINCFKKYIEIITDNGWEPLPIYLKYLIKLESSLFSYRSCNK